MNIEEIGIYLVSENPVPFENLYITGLSYGEIMKYGLEKYETMLLPYLITPEVLQIENEDIKVFDVVLADTGLFVQLVSSILLFFKIGVDKINFKEGEIIVDQSYEDSNGNKVERVCSINRDNFDELSEIVMLMNVKQKLKPKEKEKTFENERQKDIFQKLKAGRERAAKKSEFHLCDILNICEFGGNFHIPMSIIKTWNMWKIINCYSSIMGKDVYQQNFDVFLVTGDNKAIKDKHWAQEMKVSNELNKIIKEE